MQTNSERNIDENWEKIHLKIGDQKMPKKWRLRQDFFFKSSHHSVIFFLQM